MEKHTILKHLKQYMESKKDLYQIDRLGLFGSYARGESTPQSDIDIVVDFRHPDLYHQISIMQDLEKLFETRVDVIALWKRMNPKLLSRIQRDAIYV